MAVALPYSKALIARQLRIKPETLSRAFARLRKHSVETDVTGVRIKDVDRLHDLVVEEAA